MRWLCLRVLVFSVDLDRQWPLCGAPRLVAGECLKLAGTGPSSACLQLSVPLEKPVSCSDEGDCRRVARHPMVEAMQLRGGPEAR